jgi:hypothetical protein
LTRAVLIVDGDPRLAVVMCDSCRRRTWLLDGQPVSTDEALRTATAADEAWLTESSEASAAN